ncbi:MAG TPA: flagellar hook-length control protein FliK [Gammaproteobacteria bacterium]
MLTPSSAPAAAAAGQAHGPQGAEQRPDAAADAFAVLIALLASLPASPAAGSGAATGVDSVEADGAPRGGTLPPGGKHLPLEGTVPATATAGGETTAPRAARDGRDLKLLAKAAALERVMGEEAAEPVASPATARPRDAAPAAREILPTALALAADPTATRADLRAAAAEAPPTQTPPAALALEFEDAVARRVVWMLEQGVHDARLHVHPDDLGPIDIHVVARDDSADVTFHAGHALARDAIAEALPRLRELLGAAGLDLGTVSVDVRGDAQPERGPERDGGEPAAARRDEPRAAAPRPRLVLPRGLVDTFA